MNVHFEGNLAQLESSAAMVSLELALPSLGLFSNVMANRLTCFQVLSWASICQAKFTDMHRDYYKMKVEQEEAARAAAKYRDELFNCKNELKEVTEVAKSRSQSLMDLEKETEYAQLERDRAKVDLARAKAVLIKHEKVLDGAVRERNSLRIQVARVGTQVAKACEEAVQEYKANFKDMDIAEYKRP